MDKNENTIFAFDMRGQRVGAQVNFSSDLVLGDSVKGDKFVTRNVEPVVAVTFAYGQFVPKMSINVFQNDILSRLAAQCDTGSSYSDFSTNFEPVVISIDNGYLVASQYSIRVGSFYVVPSSVTSQKDFWDEAQYEYEIREYLKEHGITTDFSTKWFYIVTIL